MHLCSPPRPLPRKAQDAILNAAQFAKHTFQPGAPLIAINASGVTLVPIKQDGGSLLSANHRLALRNQRRNLASHGCANRLIHVHH
jgi:hypothetical protein